MTLIFPSFQSGEIDHELGLWADVGLTAQFWVRDDDAVAVTPQLERLATLARDHAVEIGLAVVPGRLQPDLSDRLNAGTSPFRPMCHGWVHANHADQRSPAEFGVGRPVADMRAELSRARTVMADTFAIKAPFFVPPFGQIAPALAEALPSLGFGGLSNQNPLYLSRLVRLAGARSWLLPPHLANRPVGASRLDAHIDLIDWQIATARDPALVGSRLMGELRIRRKGYVDHAAPIGLLGHHLVHDAAIWALLDGLIGYLRSKPNVAFPGLAGLMQSFRVEQPSARETGCGLPPSRASIPL